MIKKLMNISGAQVLSNAEMKMTKGGGSCGYKTKSGSWDCNVSKEVPLFMSADGTDGNWCCASSGSSSYCG